LTNCFTASFAFAFVDIARAVAIARDVVSRAAPLDDDDGRLRSNLLGRRRLGVANGGFA